MNETEIQLTPMQIKFCTEYVKLSNQGKAAVAAGYKSKNPSVKANALLKNPLIAAEVQRLKHKLANKGIMSAAAVLRSVSALASSNMADYVTFNGGKLALVKEDLTEEQMACISSVRQTKHGIEFKLYDKLDALDKLGRYHNLFNKTTHENTGAVRFDVHVHKH